MANETITGKIFTLKDPTGTYNRFPRTVMEAVYGLNTYLQNQFSALADIYMPIDGITESKPLQEFVYRLCPSSIKAKSVSLDRIYGKTLAWNQKYLNSRASGTAFADITFQRVDNYSFYYTGTASDTNNITQQENTISGHKYYFACFNGDGIYLKDGWTTNKSGIATADASTMSVGVVFLSGKTYSSSTIFKPIFIDLTLMFGAGNEPSTVAELESMFPGYHDYSAGKLISNDAESIETVGFNVWDEECEVGSINTNGDNREYQGCIRTTNYNLIIEKTYYLYSPNTAIVPFYYDADKNFISKGTTITNGQTFTPPTSAAYLRFVCQDVYGTTYNHDICINLSDPAKNGTYEPYRKSTMQLNLGSFQVRDSQGNVTTIEGGLKSDRSGKYDEIIGNKFIQRAARRAYQSGDENDQTVVTDRTYTDYGLATPVEYTLVSPLVPTVKAGITEARISPNADGLSAPMVADMTYDAQANNDSASAQYALTAGRLLNSHKLWGQDFDGTQDVTGALKGVTNINSLLYLGGTNVGIGQPNPQYKLDISGTARFTGAATLGSTLTVTGLTSIAGGLKLTTTKKIWFDDTHYLELLTENGTQYLHTNLTVVSDAGVVAGAAANS